MKILFDKRIIKPIKNNLFDVNTYDYYKLFDNLLNFESRKSD